MRSDDLTGVGKRVRMNRRTIGIVVLAIPTSIVLRLILGPVWFWISWEFFGALLVVMGCVGEWRLIAQWPRKVDRDEHHTRELKYVTEVALGVLMELIALTHSIPEARRLDKLVAELTSTNLVLRSTMAKLETEATQAKIRLGEIEERAKPRHLTPAMREKLRTRLSPLDKSKVELGCQIGDAEASDLMAEFRQEFLQSGFTNVNMALLPRSLPSGLTAAYPTNAIPQDIAAALQAVLDLGIPGQTLIEPRSGLNTITVYVGRKP